MLNIINYLIALCFLFSCSDDNNNIRLSQSEKSEDIRDINNKFKIIGGDQCKTYSTHCNVTGGIMNFPTNYRQVYCSATLIASNWAISAAHCVSSDLSKKRWIGFGPEATHEIRKIIRYILPVGYNDNSPLKPNERDDIVLLQLESPVTSRYAALALPFEKTMRCV